MAVYRSFLDRRRLRLFAPRRHSAVGLLLLLLSMVSMVLAACDAIPAATAEPDAVTLQLNWVHASDFAGFYVADAKGYYAAENLNVDILPRDPDDDVPPRQKLVDGDADFAVLSMNRIQSLDRRRGGSGRIVSHVPDIAICVFCLDGDWDSTSTRSGRQEGRHQEQ